MAGWSPPRRAGDVAAVARWVRVDGGPPTIGGDGDALLLLPPPPFHASGGTVVASADATATATATRPDRPPADGEVETLRRAFASFYGTPTAERDVPGAYELMSECIIAWAGSHIGCGGTRTW